MDEERRTPAPESPSSAGPEPQPVPPGNRNTRTQQAIQVASAFEDLATPTNILLLAVLAGLFLIGLFGGWDKLAEKKTEVPTEALGKEFEASPFKLRFSKGFWFSDVPQLYTLGTGQRGLLVTVDVTNTSAAPVSSLELKRAFRLKQDGLLSLGNPIPAEDAAPDLRRASDLQPAHTVQPGLPTRLALFWVQKETLPAPRQVTLLVYKQKYRQSAISGSMVYLDPTEALEVKVPLSQFKVGQ